MEYSYNLIINFSGQDWQTERLKKRILQKSNKDAEVDIINLTPSDLENEISSENLNYLQKVDSFSRIYIIEHSHPNSTKLGIIHYQELGDFLGQTITNEEVRKSTSKLKISLIACNAASGKHNGQKSFAGLFHRYLGQCHNIYCEVLARTEVVMIHSHTAEVGKSTTSLIEYATILSLFEMGAYNDYNDFKWHVAHQKPGSKLSFQWDTNGDEWVLDAYVEKYYSKIARLVEFVDTKESNNKIKNKNLIVADLRYFADYREMHTKNSTKVINSLLEKLILITEDSDGEMAKMIRSIFKLSCISISEYSMDPIHSENNILGSVVKEEYPIAKKIKEEIISPVIDLLKSMPKTEKEKNIKKSCQKLLQFLSDYSCTKLRKENNAEIEKEASVFIAKIIDFLIEKSIPNDTKIEYIQLMNKAIEEAIARQIIISPRFTGAIEGLNDARRIGGWTALKDLIALISINSRDKEKEITQISESLDSFIKDCIDYCMAE